VISEGALDEWGNFVFPGLLSGRYLLELVLPDHVIVVEDIEVGESHHQ
jgi:hypothetical protein